MGLAFLPSQRCDDLELLCYLVLSKYCLPEVLVAGHLSLLSLPPGSEV